MPPTNLLTPVPATPYIIEDQYTLMTVAVSDFNALRTAGVIRLVGTSFVGTIKDPNFWTETDTGIGGVSQMTGAIVLTTGATANSSAQYQSLQRALWIPGSENTFRAAMQLGDTGATGNVRTWGAFDANNGVFFRLDSTSGTTLNIGTRSNGVDTLVAKASWNVSTTFTVDTNFHIWEIRYSYAGIFFYIDHVLVHQIVLIGAATVPCPTLNLPVTLSNANTGSASANCSMTAVDAYIMRTGSLETDSTYAYLTTAGTTVLKYGAGKLHNVVICGGLGGTLTLYDNTTAAPPIIVGSIPIAAGTDFPASIVIDCSFNNGLTAVVTGAISLTVVYE